jgi:hypothetical protein
MLYMEMKGEGNQFHESNFISKVWEGSQFTAHREFFIANMGNEYITLVL